jgi:flagellum-specific peptidoglycan hydrolase FlgJ
MTKHKFLAFAKSAALASSAVSGLPAGITVAQAAIESTWGRSYLSVDHRNYFGLTEPGDLPCVRMRTSACATESDFGVWSSMTTNLVARDHLILNGETYATARTAWNSGDLTGYVRAFAHRWTTAPDYADKILRVYRAHNLAELDKVVPAT